MEMRRVLSRFGPFELDHTGHELRRAGTLVDLPASAFDCLAFLVRHRDRPVTRDEIILAVWGRPDVSETLLGQTIARLRRELGDTGSDQHSIRTISRKGYRWVAPTTAVEAEISADFGLPASDDKAHETRVEKAGSTTHPPARRGRRIAVALTLVTVLAATSAIAWWRSRETTIDIAAAIADSALVLPTATEAPAEWDWLRLGLMDLVANRLRQGGQPTMTSDSVVGLLRGLERTGSPDSPWLRDPRLDTVSKLRVQPSASLAGGQWNVHLAVADGGKSLDVYSLC